MTPEYIEWQLYKQGSEKMTKIELYNLLQSVNEIGTRMDLLNAQLKGVQQTISGHYRGVLDKEEVTYKPTSPLKSQRQIYEENMEQYLGKLPYYIKDLNISDKLKDGLLSLSNINDTKDLVHLSQDILDTLLQDERLSIIELFELHYFMTKNNLFLLDFKFPPENSEQILTTNYNIEDLDICDLNISDELKYLLRTAHIDHATDLKELTVIELQVAGWGYKRIRELDDFMKSIGWRFKDA